MEDEKEIIQAIKDGKEGAYKALYNFYSQKVYNMALNYVKNAEEAQDVTQDVFIKIYKNIKDFKGNSSLNTWVYRIVVNTCLNQMKKNTSFVLFKDGIDKNETIDFNHPAVLAENKEHAQALYIALDSLPDSQKTAFILSYIEEFPRQEVADVMKISLKAVESLLQRAKSSMRKKLEIIYPHRRKLKK